MKPLPPYRLFRTSVNGPLTSSVSVGSSVTELPDTKVSVENSEFITGIDETTVVIVLSEVSGFSWKYCG